MYLQTVDYLVIAGFLLVLLVVGFLLMRKAAGGMTDYYLGGRKLPWYLLGSSGMSSWFDVTGTMLITSFLFLMGPRGLFIEFRGGAVLVLIFLLCFTGKWHRRAQVITGAEWMRFRFGDGPDARAARILTAIVMLLLTVGMIAYLVRGTGLFMAMFLPFTPDQCAAALLAVAVIYSLVSGFYGVVISDLLQAALILCSAIALGIVAFTYIPDAQAISEVAASVTGNQNWTISRPTLTAEMPDAPEYHMFRFLTLAAGFYLLQQIVGGLGSGADPRYFAARSDRECGLLSVLISWLIMIRWPMMMSLAVLGLFLVNDMFPDTTMVTQAAALIQQYYPDIDAARWHELTARIMSTPEDFHPEMIAGLQSMLGDDWAAKLPLVGYDGIVNPERILPAVILEWVPVGMIGVVLVAALAASMSTFDSALNSASALVVRDFYQASLRPNAGRRELIGASYCTVAAVAGCGFWMGINFHTINQLWDWIVMSVSTGLLIPMALRMYWWRMNGWGVATGLAAGGITAVVQHLVAPDMAPWWKFLTVAPIATAATILGCLFSGPPPMDHLVRFYKTTRPFGFWAPVQRYLTDEQRHYIARENKWDLLSAPFVFVYMVTLFLLPMQLIIHRFDAFAWTLPVFLVAAAGMYYFWYRNLRPDRNMQDEPDLRNVSEFQQQHQAETAPTRNP